MILEVPFHKILVLISPKKVEAYLMWSSIKNIIKIVNLTHNIDCSADLSVLDRVFCLVV